MLRRAMLLLALCGLGSPAHAQAFRLAEVSGGYAFLNDPHSQTAFRLGWQAGAALTMTGWLSAVGEVSGNHATVEGFGSDTQLAIHAVMAGARASAKLGRLTEFFQVVAGGARGSGNRFGVSDTNHAIALQPGVGVDVLVRRHLAARAQLDLRVLKDRRGGVDAARQIRFVAAIVYRTQR